MIRTVKPQQNRTAMGRLSGLRGVHATLVACAMLAGGAVVAESQTALTFVPGVSRLAGTGSGGSTGLNGPALSAKIHGPRGVVQDTQGNIYFSDYSNNVVDVIRASTGFLSIFAGGGTVCSGSADSVGDGCAATQATLTGPDALTFDAAGNLYIAEYGGGAVRMVNALTGVITKVAGGGTSPSTCTGSTDTIGDGCVATQALLREPSGLAVDAAGNLYVSDYLTNPVRIVNAKTGIIMLYAGAGLSGSSGDGGLATKGRLSGPSGLKLDAAGNLYIADKKNGLVRLVTASTGFLSTVAGTNTGTTTPMTGYSGDGGPALSATMLTPSDIALLAGNVFVADTGNNVVRVVNAAGTIATYAGATASGAVNTVCAYGDSLGNGCAAVQAKFSSPYALSVDNGGGLLVSDYGNSEVRKIALGNDFGQYAVGSAAAASRTEFVQANQSGTINSVQIAAGFTEFGTSGLSWCTTGTALASGTICAVGTTFLPKFPGLRGAAVQLTDGLGNQYSLGLRGVGTAPEAVFSQSLISTTAGTGVAGYKNASSAVAAQFSGNAGMAIDSSGAQIVADAGNHAVRRIDGVTGAVTTLAGTGVAGYSGDGGASTAATLNRPAGVALDLVNARTLIADTGNHALRAVSAQGIITTIAGTGSAGYSGDGGVPTSAALRSPAGVAVDYAGNVYIADTGNNVIRRISLANVITTFAGTGTPGNSGDGGPATAATLSAPAGLVVDGSGNLYIADAGNHAIRKVVLATGIISTVAGSGSAGNSGDGGAATAAMLNGPKAIAVDAAGDLYIADTGNHTIRFVGAATGLISTIAGAGSSGYAGDGGLATVAKLALPAGVAVDGGGIVVVSDTGNSVLRTVGRATAPALSFGAQSVGTTSAPQSVLVTNAGNVALSFSAITATAPFALYANTSGDCSTSAVLAPGASCTVSVTFTPVSNAAATGSLTLSDNSLNATSTQVIALASSNPAFATSTTLAVVPGSGPVVYGTTLQLTATVAEAPTNTNAYTGSVVIYDGATQIDSGVPSSSGTVPYTAMPIVGSHSYSASFVGDANHGPSQSGSTAITVQKASTITTLAASGSTVRIGTTVTLTVTVAPQIAGVPTGNVTFSAAGTSLGTVALSNGVATLALTTLPAGANGITATYAGDTNFTGSSSSSVTVTIVIIPDFSVTATPSSLTIPAGQSGVVNFTVTPSYAYTGTIAFSCGSLPANVTCRFIPSTPLSATGTNAVLQAQLLLTTGGSSATQLAVVKPRPVSCALWALLLLPGVMACGPRRNRRWVGRMGLCLAVLIGLAVALGLQGCSQSATPAPTASPGTTVVQVTATGSSGNIAHTVAVTLTVQ